MGGGFGGGGRRGRFNNNNNNNNFSNNNNGGGGKNHNEVDRLCDLIEKREEAVVEKERKAEGQRLLEAADAETW